MKVYSRAEEKMVDMIPCFDAQETKVIGFFDPKDSNKIIIPAEMFELPASVDWEQRRYEIAREILPYAAETSRSILISGHSLGDDAQGKTLAEVCASSAVSFADALIAELRKQPNPETKPEKQPDKKGVAIGEVVECQGEHLLCVEKTDNEDCSGCAFLAEDDDCKFSGYCCKEFRSDGKNVIFMKGGSSEA